MHSPSQRAADPELDDLTLVRAQRGDGAAFEQLVKRYEGMVWAYLWRMLGGAASRPAVEDLFQETFFGVHRGLGRFAPAGPARLSTWILTIATRAVLQRRRTLRHDTAAVVPPEPDDGGEQVQRLERRALVAALVAGLEALTPELRAVFVLREFHELVYEDIARVLEIELGTVRSRLHRARESLRKALEEDSR